MKFLQSNKIKYINSLKLSKFRKLLHEFVAEGDKLVIELLKSRFEISNVYSTAEWIEQNEQLLKNSKVDVTQISNKELGKISFLSTPNNVLTVVKIPKPEIIQDNIFSDLILMLDEIQDPGNLGSIIRTADWFGIKHIICSENCVDIYNPKVVQATMGSIARVSVLYKNPEKVLAGKPKQIKVYGTLLKGENIYNKNLSKNGIILIGNESKGISDNLLPFITDKISIPSFPKTTGKTQYPESLNASIATAIVCAEFRRQYLFGNKAT